MNSKKLAGLAALVIGLGAVGLLNSKPLLASVTHFLFWVDHNQVKVEAGGTYQSGYVLVDHKNRKSHEIKMGGDGLVPHVFYYPRYGKNFLWFESSGTGPHGREVSDRSEVRLLGVSQDFDKEYYTSFRIYYPSWAVKTPKGPFNIIWQCPQIGAAIPYIPYNTSPPLSLQIKDDRLKVVTFQNYKVESPEINFHSMETDLGPVPRDRWVRVMMHFRMGARGFHTIWVDGVKRLTTHQPMGYQNAYNPFVPGLQNCTVRYGMYKSGAIKGRYAILFDDVKIGTNYDEVRP